MATDAARVVLPASALLIESIVYFTNKIAVSYSNGSITLFDRQHYFPLFTFPATSASQSTRKLIAHGTSKLISAGIDGIVRVFDLDQMKEIETLDLHSGAIWDIKLSNTGDKSMLFCACENGSVYALEIKEFSIMEYKKIPGVSKNRLLSIEILGDGFIFVGDCCGMVYRISKNFHVDGSVKVNSESTIIWCLSPGISEKTLICGDSTGKISVIDIDLLIVTSEFKEHQADVLSIVKYGDYLFAAGVDSKIAKFNDKGTVSTYFIHTRDVSTLAILEDGTIISGGADGQLAVYKEKKGTFGPLKLQRIPPSMKISYSANGHLILANIPSKAARLFAVKFDGSLTALAELSLKDGEDPYTAELSGSGNLIVLSAPSGTRVLRFDLEKLSVTKIASSRRNFHMAKFTTEEDSLVLLNAQGILWTWKFVDDDFVRLHQFSSPVTSLATSGNWVGVGTADGQVASIDLSTEGNFQSTRIKSDGEGQLITALCIVENALIAVTARGSLCSFILNSLEFKWRRNLGKIKNVGKATVLIRNVNFLDDHRLIISGERVLITADPEGVISFVDPIEEGMGLICGVWCKDKRRVNSDAKRTRLVGDQKGWMITVMDLKELEKSLPVPFKRKSFHK
jgi:WD40 repeat protein